MVPAKKAEAPPSPDPGAEEAEAAKPKKAAAKKAVATAGGWVDYGDGKGYVLPGKEE